VTSGSASAIAATKVSFVTAESSLLDAGQVAETNHVR